MKHLLLSAISAVCCLHAGSQLSYSAPSSALALSECVDATNLTESWRRDYNGSGIRPGGSHSAAGYACDLRKDLKWFRFSGLAGNRLYKKCPPVSSCGSINPIWTDEEEPTEVGVPALINAYVSLYPGFACDIYVRQVEVVRCSYDTEYDFVYRYTGNVGYPELCSEAFCGML